MNYFEYMASYIGGGGSAVDDGFHIMWDNMWDTTTEGRPFIDLSFMVGINGITAFSLYKVSSVILSAEQLANSRYILWSGFLSDENSHSKLIHDMHDIFDDLIYQADGWIGVFTIGNDMPYVVSGKAGNYIYEGIPVTIPEDGTYFMRYEIDSYIFAKLTDVYKAASI